MTCRWGILSTGWISTKFALDLLVEPSTRQVDDVKHEIVAVASRSVEKAQQFIDKVYKESGTAAAPKSVKAYGSYQELYDDPNVQVIYVGTPHSHHYQNVARALKAGKAVICEKPMTVNAKQAQELVDLARKHDTFLMEALWLRFTPVAFKVQQLVKDGTIGDVTRVVADLSQLLDRKAMGDSHRMFNPDLAGGALLDLGPYPWTWLAMTLFQSSGATTQKIAMPEVSSSMVLNDLGTDHETSATIKFRQPNGSDVLGVLTTAVGTHRTDDRVVQIHGTKGYINVAFPAYRPERISYASWKSTQAFKEDADKPDKAETIDFTDRPGGIWGFSWEADEVARCLKAGKKESDRMPLAETVLMMSVFDEIRKQNGMKYPEHIETTELWKDELQY